MSRNATFLRNSQNAGTGAFSQVSVTEVVAGNQHSVTLKLNSLPVTVGNTSGASFGSKKLYDFLAGRVYMIGGTANLSFAWTGEDIAATGSGDFSIGTTATADATLNSTDVNLLESTAMLDPFVAGVGTGTGAFAAPAAFDGTTTAIDMYLNMIIDDADVADGASDTVLVSGTIHFAYFNLGDY